MSSDREEKIKMFKKEFNAVNTYNRPIYCDKCGGVMVFKGVGEYHCEKCGYVDYDDYGKVRNYIEKHVGANAAQVSNATGVSQKAIRELLKESRIEITPDSAIFLRCEICGAAIRGGRYCPKCETAYHKNVEEMARKSRHREDTFGYSTERRRGEEGSKRFTRE